MLTLSSVYRGFKFGQVKPRTIKLVFVAVPLHAAIRSKSKDWFTRYQNNVSAWSDMSIRGLLLQLASTIKNPTWRVGLVQSRHHYHFQ